MSKPALGHVFLLKTTDLHIVIPLPFSPAAPLHHPYRRCAPLDSDGDDTIIDATIKLCEDLSVNPRTSSCSPSRTVELKSPAMGQWSRKS